MRNGWMIAGLLALPAGAGAQVSPTTVPPPAAVPGAGSAQGDVSVTIYNGDVALVQDVRQLTLAAGRIRQSFPDVSAQIRPETVSLTMPDAGIVEQNSTMICSARRA